MHHNRDPENLLKSFKIYLLQQENRVPDIMFKSFKNRTQRIFEILSNLFKNKAILEILSKSFKNNTKGPPEILLNSFKNKTEGVLENI